jgi:hypothetical protein
MALVKTLSSNRPRATGLIRLVASEEWDLPA